VRVNISGYEAVEDGLNAGGIDRFICNIVREPLCNAEEVISKGSFFASSHLKTAGMIYEKDAGAIRYAIQKKDSQNAAFEIIILGRDLSRELLHTLKIFSVPLFAAEDVRDIRRMTEDGLMYSGLRRTPVAVFIPLRLLRSRQAVCTDGKYCCDDLWRIGVKERSDKTALLERKYNRSAEICRSDKDCRQCLVIGISGCAGIINEMVGNAKGVTVCKLDMFGAMTAEAVNKSYDRVIIIGHGSGYVEEMLREKRLLNGMCMSVELSGSRLHEITEIYSGLREFLPLRRSEAMGTDGVYGYMPVAASRSQYTLTNQMCPDCPCREVIRGISEEAADTNVYEDIYCERRGTIVRSGMTNVSSAYTGNIIVTNRKNTHYTGLNVRFVELKCAR